MSALARFPCWFGKLGHVVNPADRLSRLEIDQPSLTLGHWLREEQLSVFQKEEEDPAEEGGAWLSSSVSMASAFGYGRMSADLCLALSARNLPWLDRAVL
jgi:hypothetical protein